MLVTIEVMEDEVFVVVGNVDRANTAYARGFGYFALRRTPRATFTLSDVGA